MMMNGKRQPESNGESNGVKKRKKASTTESSSATSSGFSLDDVLGHMDNGNLRAVIDSFSKFFNESRARAKSESHESLEIEIEARIGHFDSANCFCPGLHNERFKHLQTRLDGCNYGVTISHKIDYIYPEGIRIEVNPATGAIESAAIKQKMNYQNYYRPEFKTNFDFRLGFATEKGARLEEPDRLPPDYIRSREKFRRSYRKTGEDWRIDLTYVKTGAPGRREGETYEVEIELEQASLWKLETESETNTLISKLWEKINYLSDVLDFVPSLPNFPSITCFKIPQNKINRLKGACSRYFGEQWEASSQDSFPGSLPVSFSRRHFEEVLHGSKTYWISEKTDGIRYLVLILPKNSNEPDLQGVYLIDRKFSFYMLSGMEFLIDLVSANGPTILDGEMINKKGSETPMFLIFDIVHFNGDSVMEQPLSARLQKVGTVVNKFREATSQGKDKKPIELIGKVFFPKQSFAKLLNCIHDENGSHYFKDGKRYHKTDGIIFTPDTPYGRRRGAGDLFKWKYPTHLTVDFKLVVQRNQRYVLTCRGKGHDDVEIGTADFPPEDQFKLQEDLRNHTVLGTPVVECSYDIWMGKWRYHTLRTDKDTSNYIGVVFETMQTLAENVTMTEITYRFTTSHSSIDYKNKVHSFLQTLVPKPNPPPNRS